MVQLLSCKCLPVKRLWLFSTACDQIGLNDFILMDSVIQSKTRLFWLLLGYFDYLLRFDSNDLHFTKEAVWGYATIFYFSNSLISAFYLFISSFCFSLAYFIVLKMFFLKFELHNSLLSLFWKDLGTFINFLMNSALSVFYRYLFHYCCFLKV